MHVAHVYDGHERIYEGRGSVPTVVWNVARETARRGHRVAVLERQWDGLDARAEHDGVRFERFDLRTGATVPWERVPYEMVESPWGIARLVGDRVNFARAALARIRELDPDVVHVHLPFAAGVLVTVAPWLRERTVYTAHLGELRLNALTTDQTTATDASVEDGGTIAESGTEEEGLSVPGILSLVSPDVYLSKRVAATTVLNQGVADVFADRGVPRDRVTVVPNGVDVDRFSDVPEDRVSAVREEHDVGDDLVVLFVGTVMPRKGVDDLVRALGHLSGDGATRGVRAVVAGEDDLDGEYTGDVRSLAREVGVGGEVTFAGFVPDEELEALYSLADVFVLPSREEGFGMTAAEAMAAGTPVVATDVGALPRLIDEGQQGYLVSPNDPAGLSDRIERVLTADDAHSLSGRARERARQYSWREVGGQFETVYEEVAG